MDSTCGKLWGRFISLSFFLLFFIYNYNGEYPFQHTNRSTTLSATEFVFFFIAIFLNCQVHLFVCYSIVINVIGIVSYILTIYTLFFALI